MAGPKAGAGSAEAERVRSVVLSLLDDGEGSVSKDASLIELGLASLGATELPELGVRVLATLLFSYPSVSVITGLMLGLLVSSGKAGGGSAAEGANADAASAHNEDHGDVDLALVTARTRLIAAKKGKEKLKKDDEEGRRKFDEVIALFEQKIAATAAPKPEAEAEASKGKSKGKGKKGGK